MTEFYRAANGQMRAIAQMPTPHLANAIAKLERDDPMRRAEIDAMRAEHATRQDKEHSR